MKILFLHGLGSKPGGVKPTFLENHGLDVLNPQLPDGDFDESIRIAESQLEDHQPDVIVGSSRGGSVAMNMDSGNTPLVLLCPAWKSEGKADTVKAKTVILHSKDDGTVPFGDSEELVQRSSLPAESLLNVGEDHQLADGQFFEGALESPLAFTREGGEGWACCLLLVSRRSRT